MNIPFHLRPDPPITLTSDPTLSSGQHWYIKLPNTISLSEVLIEEVTPKTVLLKPIEKNQPMRYKKSDIEFVEKVEKSL